MDNIWLLDIPRPKPLYRYDQSSGDRRYARVKDDGTVLWYPSVTTVIRGTSPMPPGLMAWYAKHGMEGANELRDAAAERGTEMHLHIAKAIAGYPVDLSLVSDFQAKALLSFEAFRIDYQVEPVALEVMLWHDRYCYAGACDLVAYLTDPKTKRRHLAVVDFKSGSSSYDDHAVQTAMYAEAWNETIATEANNPSLVIYDHYNWHPKDWRTKPTYTVVNNTGKVTQSEIAMRSQLYCLNNDVKPKSKMLFSGTLPGDAHYITIDPDDVIFEAYRNTTTQVRIFEDSAPVLGPSAPTPQDPAPFESNPRGI